MGASGAGGGVIFEVCRKTTPLSDATIRRSLFPGILLCGRDRSKVEQGHGERAEEGKGISSRNKKHGPQYCLLNRSYFYK